MGWQDRDYANQDSYQAKTGARGPLIPRGWSAVWILLAINIAMFLLTRRNPATLGSLLFLAEEVLHGQVWRLLTACFLHADTGHLFGNMLGLYFFGNSVEAAWGRRRFTVAYLSFGVISNAAIVVLYLLGWGPAGHPALGASGCVFGILAACAVLYPRTTVLVFFILPMNVRVFMGLMAAYSVMRTIQGGMGDAVHLLGAVLGWAYTVHGHKIGRVTTTRTAHPPRAPEPVSRGQQDKLEAEADRILEKIQRQGISSLSEKEKSILAQASKAQRADDQRFGRMDRL